MKTNVSVKLVDEDGNAFAIMARVCKALKQNGHNDLITTYMTEAMAGDYDNLLNVTMNYVNVE